MISIGTNKTVSLSLIICLIKECASAVGSLWKCFTDIEILESLVPNISGGVGSHKVGSLKLGR